MYQGKLIVKLVGLDARQCALLAALETSSSLEPEVSLLDQARFSAPDLENVDAVLFCLHDAGMLADLDSLLDALVVANDARLGDEDFHGLEKSTDLILLADSSIIPQLGDRLERIDDIWPLPQSDEELRYRFNRYYEQRKAFTDAWETKQFLEATINSTPSLVWFKTRDGIHEKVNDSFCATVNKTKEQVQGQGHAYIWDVEQDDPACIESEDKVMSTQEMLVSEEVVQTSEGEPRLLTTYKSPLYNIDGGVMGTVGLAIDITQERAYEESLIEKNHSLETIFTSLECGVLTHSLDGTRIVGVNKAALNILGYESEEELEQGFDMIARSVMEEDRARLLDVIDTLEKEGDSASIEYRVLHDDGSITYVIGNIKLIRQDDELLYQRFLFDYSDERIKQAQVEAHQRDQIRALSEDYVAVCGFDLDTGEGEVLRLSPNHQTDLEKIFNASHHYADVMSAYIHYRVTEEDREQLCEAVTPQNVIEELERADRYEIPYRISLNGEDAYCQMTIVRSGSWEDGDNHKIVIGFRNVDRQTRKENERKQVLEDALKRATRANEAKSLFLSNMSHDIRTPLNAILGFTSLADTHIDDTARIQQYLNKIHTSGEHLLNLINDILDMSKIESGKATLDIEPHDFKALVESLEDILHSNAEEKDLELVVDASGLSNALVLCDKLKVRQILLNLAGNAVKFTEPGGSVTIRAEELPDHSPDVARYRITISDTGIGMSKEFIEHLYDPFERERTSTISGIQGTGLGMAIAKSLLDMMGGRIEVESEQGKGTTFTVILTLNRAEDISPDDVNTTPADSEPSPADRVRDARILLVEDNILNREIALTLLEDAGFNVEYVCDGQEAVDLLSQATSRDFDIILMDIQMPRMNGYEAATAIRALENRDVAATPILAVTADAFESDKQKALQCGMNGHLPKPIQIDDLFMALHLLLDQ